MSCQPFVRKLLTPLLHFASFISVKIDVSPQLPAPNVIHRESFGRSKQPISKIGSPRSLLARIILVLLHPSIMDGRGHLVRFDLGQRLRSCAQVRPPPLDFHERFGVPAFGFSWIASLQASLLFALADERAQIFWHTLTEPVDPTVRMLPWTGHCKRHCTSLLYQAGGLKPLILLISF